MFGDRTDAPRRGGSSMTRTQRGINFIDTADVYAQRRLREDRRCGDQGAIGGDGSSRRRSAIPITKKPHDGGLVPALDARRVRRQPRASRHRLHRHLLPAQRTIRTPRSPETVGAVGDLIRSGKIRYFGVSNYRGWRIAEVVSECEAQGVPLPVVCQPYYNLLNRDARGRDPARLRPLRHRRRAVFADRPRRADRQVPRPAPSPEDSRVARKDQRMLETEFREESLAIAQKLAAHAQKTGRTLTQFALAWLWANRIVTSVIAGPRTFDQWRDYVGALGTKWSDDDEALVDSLVAPGHPSTPGYSDPQYPFFGRLAD